MAPLSKDCSDDGLPSALDVVLVHTDAHAPGTCLMLLSAFGRTCTAGLQARADALKDPIRVLRMMARQQQEDQPAQPPTAGDSDEDADTAAIFQGADSLLLRLCSDDPRRNPYAGPLRACEDAAAGAPPLLEPLSKALADAIMLLASALFPSARDRMPALGRAALLLAARGMQAAAWAIVGALLLPRQAAGTQPDVSTAAWASAMAVRLLVVPLMEPAARRAGMANVSTSLLSSTMGCLSCSFHGIGDLTIQSQLFPQRDSQREPMASLLEATVTTARSRDAQLMRMGALRAEPFASWSGPRCTRSKASFAAAAAAAAAPDGGGGGGLSWPLLDAACNDLVRHFLAVAAWFSGEQPHPQPTGPWRFLGEVNYNNFAGNKEQGQVHGAATLQAHRADAALRGEQLAVVDRWEYDWWGAMQERVASACVAHLVLCMDSVKPDGRRLGWALDSAASQGVPYTFFALAALAPLLGDMLQQKDEPAMARLRSHRRCPVIAAAVDAAMDLERVSIKDKDTYISCMNYMYVASWLVPDQDAAHRCLEQVRDALARSLHTFDYTPNAEGIVGPLVACAELLHQQQQEPGAAVAQVLRASMETVAACKKPAMLRRLLAACGAISAGVLEAAYAGQAGPTELSDTMSELWVSAAANGALEIMRILEEEVPLAATWGAHAAARARTAAADPDELRLEHWRLKALTLMVNVGRDSDDADDVDSMIRSMRRLLDAPAPAPPLSPEGVREALVSGLERTVIRQAQRLPVAIDELLSHAAGRRAVAADREAALLKAAGGSACPPTIALPLLRAGAAGASPAGSDMFIEILAGQPPGQRSCRQCLDACAAGGGLHHAFLACAGEPVRRSLRHFLDAGIGPAADGELPAAAASVLQLFALLPASSRIAPCVQELWIEALVGAIRKRALALTSRLLDLAAGAAPLPLPLPRLCGDLLDAAVTAGDAPTAGRLLDLALAAAASSPVPVPVLTLPEVRRAAVAATLHGPPAVLSALRKRGVGGASDEEVAEALRGPARAAALA